MLRTTIGPDNSDDSSSTSTAASRYEYARTGPNRQPEDNYGRAAGLRQPQPDYVYAAYRRERQHDYGRTALIRQPGSRLFIVMNADCNDDAQREFAVRVYYSEPIPDIGVHRLARHEANARERYQFARPRDHISVEVGFRLIAEDLATSAGRARIFALHDIDPQGSNSTSNRLPLPIPIRIFDSDDQLGVVRQPAPEERSQLYGGELGFRPRMVSGELMSTHLAVQPPDGWRPRGPDGPLPRTRSPDGPLARTYRPDRPLPLIIILPRERSQREIREDSLDGYGQMDLASIHRQVRTLALRNDVSEEWWMRMGLLHLARSSGHWRRSRALGADATDRVRSGRIDRPSPPRR